MEREREWDKGMDGERDMDGWRDRDEWRVRGGQRDGWREGYG